MAMPSDVGKRHNNRSLKYSAAGHLRRSRSLFSRDDVAEIRSRSGPGVEFGGLSGNDYGEVTEKIEVHNKRRIHPTAPLFEYIHSGCNDFS
jgi:hypothetical protein